MNVFAAATDRIAARLFTSLQQQFANLFRGTPGQLPPPVEDMNTYWSPGEAAGIARALCYACVGAPDTVRSLLREFIDMTKADELMITAQIFDHQARLRSFEIAAEL